jgi:hypothetical protein
MLRSERANECLSKAEACLAAAELAHDPNIRATYLNLADRWQKLAKQREELLAERKRG